ncbi:MAG: GNAT family N-acetyltransferase [Rhizobiales bacterium]|nr:GNAT family N-acetyltransferase [Hyphomicrobiales bacterium]
MIRVIDRLNCNRHPDIIDQIFKLRRRVFVEELGWTQFDVDGVYERDQYDDDHAIHLASLNFKGQVVGYCRLYPTTLPHMLSEVFSNFVAGRVPQRSDILELTRAAVEPNYRGKKIWEEVFIGAHEFCQMHGVGAMTSFIRTLRVPYFQAAGMKLTPLGLPGDCNGEQLSAVSLEVSEEVIESMRRRSGIDQSVLESNTEHRKIA